MIEESTHASMTDQSETKTPAIHWAAASILAVLALLGGVLLGRVAFVNTDDPTPLIESVKVLDSDFNANGTIEYLPEEEVYILTLRGMPPPPADKVFQVWVQVDDLIVPAGVLNPNSRDFAFAAYDGRYDRLFITTEAAPFGSEQPTSTEIITVNLGNLEVGVD